MKIYYLHGFTQIPQEVNFVRTSKALCWTSTDKWQLNGIYPYHETIMETIVEKFPNTVVSYRKNGRIRIRFQNDADEAIFLLTSDNIIMEIDP